MDNNHTTYTKYPHIDLATVPKIDHLRSSVVAINPKKCAHNQQHLHWPPKKYIGFAQMMNYGEDEWVSNLWPTIRTC